MMQRVVAPDEVITSPPTAESTGLEHLLPRVKDCDEMGVQSPQVKIPTKKNKACAVMENEKTPQVILNKTDNFYLKTQKVNSQYLFLAPSLEKLQCRFERVYYGVHISLDKLYYVVHISLIVTNLFLSSDVIVERDRLLDSGETQSDL